MKSHAVSMDASPDLDEHQVRCMVCRRVFDTRQSADMQAMYLDECAGAPPLASGERQQHEFAYRAVDNSDYREAHCVHCYKVFDFRVAAQLAEATHGACTYQTARRLLFRER